MRTCRTCRTCGLSKNIDRFEVSRVVNGREYIRSSCRECVAGFKRAKRKEVAKPKVFKREPKIISPEFVRTSIVSTGNVHTVIATIRKGYKLFKYEEKFAIHRKAVLFVEQINEYPLLADQYLGKSKLIKNNSIYGRDEV